MKTPITLDSKKLAGYSAMVASFLAVNKSDAQIVYTDITPDTSLYIHYSGEDLLLLDLNGDGQSDLKLRIYVARGSEWSTAYYDAIPAPDLAMIHKQKGGIAALSSSFEVNHPIP